MALIRRSSFSFPRQWNQVVPPTWAAELDTTHPLANNLVGLYPFADGTGRDYSLSQNNAVLVGTPPAVIGPLGPSLSTNASGVQYIVLMPNAVVSGAYSVAFWMLPTDFGGQGVTLCSRQPGDTSFDLHANTGGLHADVGTGSSWIDTSADSSCTLVLNVPQHIAMTVNQTGFVQYLNGAAVGNGSWGASTPLLCDSSHALHLGDIQNSVGLAVTAQWSAVAIYGRVLAASEVAQIYAEPFAMLRPVVRRTYSVPVSSAETITVDKWYQPPSLRRNSPPSFVALGGTGLVPAFSPVSAGSGGGTTVPKIANVHYNLTAWASGTYSAKQRVSSGGNAYQCIVPGASTAAPTGTGSSINNGGAAVWAWLSAIDYTSLTAWQADTTNYPLVLTQPYEVHLWNNGGVSMTTTSGVPFFQLTGHTTSATNTITIKCAPGESLRDGLFAGGQLNFAQQLGVSFLAPASGSFSANWFEFDDANVIIDGIQFRSPNAADASSVVAFGGAAARMQNCIVDGFGQASGSSVIGGNTVTGQLTLANCLIVDRQTNNAGTTFTHSYSACTVVNCTIVATTATSGVAACFSLASGSTTTVKNCIIINYDTTGSVATNGTANVDHSLFSTTSLAGSGVTTGTGCLFGQAAAATFVSFTDFRLLPTSAAINAGTTDLTDIPTSDDIAKTIRPVGVAWDIGVWEFVPTPTLGSYSPRTEQPNRARAEMVPY